MHKCYIGRPTGAPLTPHFCQLHQKVAASELGAHPCPMENPEPDHVLDAHGTMVDIQWIVNTTAPDLDGCVLPSWRSSWRPERSRIPSPVCTAASRYCPPRYPRHLDSPCP